MFGAFHTSQREQELYGICTMMGEVTMCFRHPRGSTAGRCARPAARRVALPGPRRRPAGAVDYGDDRPTPPLKPTACPLGKSLGIPDRANKHGAEHRRIRTRPLRAVSRQASGGSRFAHAPRLAALPADDCVPEPGTRAWSVSASVSAQTTTALPRGEYTDQSLCLCSAPHTEPWLSCRIILEVHVQTIR